MIERDIIRKGVSETIMILFGISYNFRINYQNSKGCRIQCSIDSDQEFSDSLKGKKVMTNFEGGSPRIKSTYSYLIALN